ncbi:MAG: DUF6744 family protein, partial [bacterium]
MTNDIQSALASGSRKIGFLTWYDCRNASVTPTKLKALFDKHSLDESHFPDSIKPQNAFQKACRKAMAETSTSSDTRRSITKLIVDGLDKIIYGVVDLNVHEKAESIDPDFSDKVWLDKNTLSVGFDKGHDLSRNVKKIFDQLCGEYTTRDISRMIVKSLDHMASVSLRDAGVIYFVPVGFEKSLLALQGVVNDVGECNMRVFALGSSDGNSAGIEKAARSQIADKIEGMKEDIADLKESIESGTVKGKTVDNSIEVRRKRFNDLKMRCQVLADALKIKADTLEGNLSEVEDLIN